jgi:hypothetical protein
MRRVALLTILLAFTAGAAEAQPRLPLGEADGVRAQTGHGGVVLVFSKSAAKLRKQINSPYAWIEVVDLGEPFTSVGSGNLDVPRRGRRVRTGFGAGDADFCRIFLRAHKTRHGRIARRVLFSIPFTQTGAVYLDEEEKTAAMYNVGLAASLAKPDAKQPGALTYAQLIAAVPRLRRAVVELVAPGDSPPPARVGYFSDGREHTVLAVLSGLGRRLFIEQSAGQVLSTNVAKYLFGDPL